MRASILMALALVLTAACNDDSTSTDTSFQIGSLTVHETISRFSVEQRRDSEGIGMNKALLWLYLEVERPEGDVDRIADGGLRQGTEDNWRLPDQSGVWDINEDQTEAILFAFWEIDERVPVNGHTVRLEHEDGDIVEADVELTVHESNGGEYFYNPAAYTDNDGQGIPTLGFVTVDVVSLTNDELELKISYKDERLNRFYVRFLDDSDEQWVPIADTRYIGATEENNKPDGQDSTIILQRGTDDIQLLESGQVLEDATHFVVLAFARTTEIGSVERPWLSSFDIGIPMPTDWIMP